MQDCISFLLFNTCENDDEAKPNFEQTNKSCVKPNSYINNLIHFGLKPTPKIQTAHSISFQKSVEQKQNNALCMFPYIYVVPVCPATLV